MNSLEEQPKPAEEAAQEKSSYGLDDIDFEQLIEELNETRKEYRELEQDNEVLLANIKARLQEEGRSEVEIKKIFEDLLLSVKYEALKTFGNSGNLGAFEKAYSLLENAPVGRLGSSAAYSKDGKILVDEERRKEEDPYNLLLTLADIGRSLHLTDIHHEYIHSRQADPKQARLEKIKGFLNRLAPYAALSAILEYPKTTPLVAAAYYVNHLHQKSQHKKRTILAETQAFRGSDRFTHDFLSTIQHLEVLQDDYGVLSKGKDIDMAIIADQSIRRLYALGVSDEEIGSLVREAKWDNKNLLFTTLEKKTKDLMNEKGLDEGDLDNLVMAQELKNKINFMKTRLLASKIIKEFHEKIISTSLAA